MALNPATSSDIIEYVIDKLDMNFSDHDIADIKAAFAANFPDLQLPVDLVLPVTLEAAHRLTCRVGTWVVGDGSLVESSFYLALAHYQESGRKHSQLAGNIASVTRGDESYTYNNGHKIGSEAHLKTTPYGSALSAILVGLAPMAIWVC
ncbi:MAG: hypothetical protein QS721_09570 [Candidatus Endonucleobacter sp. (ex Gigantidas childressi)]|nr:hypothetical protein [Candidatus Endonucleobacter sp. (ex Gigantidas childressi)]